MGIYLDERTLDSLLLDETNTAVVAENFTYLLKNLMVFIDPQYKYKSVKRADDVAGKTPGVLGAAGNKAGLRGGRRRMTRGEREWTLPYTITSKGTKTEDDVFGSDIDVDVWEVSHGAVTDPDLGETYPTQNSSQKTGVVPRGPYTCKLTARASLINRVPTRCYVSCTCEDFKSTFYERLNDEGYTKSITIDRSTGKKELSPAMCKHLYAIFNKEYRKLVEETEGWVSDQSAVLFGGPEGTEESGSEDQGGVSTVPTPSSVAATKEEAVALIQKELKKIHDKFEFDPNAYLDSRSKASGGGRHHLYMFYVVQVNNDIRAIAYRNNAIAGSTSKNVVLLQIPNNPKIWNFFTKRGAFKSKHPDHAFLWDMIRSLGPMPQKVQKSVQKKVGIGVYMEEVEHSLTDFSFIHAGNSSILMSISELN